MSDTPDLDVRLADAVDRLARARRHGRQVVASRLGLTGLQLSLLVALRERPLQRVGALAAEMAVTQPTVSDSLRALVDKGLAERTSDPADLRATVVDLTAAGRDMADGAHDEFRRLTRPGTSVSAAELGTTLRVVLEQIRSLHRSGLIEVDRSCATCHHFLRGGPGGQARCQLLQRDLPDEALRVDCPEHHPMTVE